MDQEQKIKLGLDIASFAVKATATIGSIYLTKYMIDKIGNALRHVEYEPSQSGQLLRVEYHGDKAVDTRYATAKEIEDYSREQMNNHLKQLGFQIIN